MTFMPDKIVECFAAAFAADPNLKVLVPGGCWHVRAPDAKQGGTTGPRRPYATVRVEPQPKEFVSDFSCLQSFTITAAVYAEETAANAGEIAAYLASGFDFAKYVLESQNLPGRCVGLFPGPEALGLDSQQRLGKDVVIAVKTWSLVMHTSA